MPRASLISFPRPARAALDRALFLLALVILAATTLTSNPASSDGTRVSALVRTTTP